MLLAVSTSFGFVTSAVLVKNVLLEVTRTGTVISGNEAPIARLSRRLQLNVVDQLAPIQVQPFPVGFPVKVTPAGSGSTIVVTELVSPPDPAFFTSRV